MYVCMNVANVYHLAMDGLVSTTRTLGEEI